MNILALDLGTKCGWAIDQRKNGVWNFKPSSFDSYGERFRRFKTALESSYEEITHVVYEEVRAHFGVDAAHSYGGYMAILQTWCIECKIEYKGVPVGTIKKYATGKGNAKKPDMILAANRLFPSINVIDDNHADALCLLSWAQKNLIY